MPSPINRSNDSPSPRVHTEPHTPENAATPGTVMVNGKPVEPTLDAQNPTANQFPERDDARASGATKEAAASKVAEQKMAGKAQEARLRSAKIEDDHAPNIFKATESGTVMVNSRDHIRKEPRDCEDPREVLDRETNRRLYSDK